MQGTFYEMHLMTISILTGCAHCCEAEAFRMAVLIVARQRFHAF